MSAFDQRTARVVGRVQRSRWANGSVEWQPASVGSRLREISEKLFDEHNAVAPAVDALIQLAKTDAEVMEDLMRGALEERAQMAIKFARAVFSRRDNGAPREAASRNEALAVAGAPAASLLDTFQLPDGTYLRDATRDDILAAAEFYREQANHLFSMARWMRMIAQGLAPGQTVGSRLSGERVEELQRVAESSGGDDDQ